MYCVVCVIEYGWYVGRGDCGVCGWKDRCRNGNLRTYCHVSPILFGWFFVEASPTCFFCEMLFLELVSSWLDLRRDSVVGKIDVGMVI